jgi:hypothetical protein
VFHHSYSEAHHSLRHLPLRSPTMLSQLPNRTYKTFSILIALFISYTLLKIFFGDVSDTLWSQKLSHFSHSGIRDGALDHIFNKTLGVSIELVHVTNPSEIILTNLFVLV